MDTPPHTLRLTLTVGNATDSAKSDSSSRNHSIPLLRDNLMSANKPNLDGLLIFEQPFARVSLSYAYPLAFPALYLPLGSVRELP